MGLLLVIMMVSGIGFLIFLMGYQKGWNDLIKEVGGLTKKQLKQLKKSLPDA